MPAYPFSANPRRRSAGMSLVEVMIAALIFAMSMGGILAALIQSRRLTEGSVRQNAAVTAVQGYMEQLKRCTLIEFLGTGFGQSYGVPLVNANGAVDTLWTSTCPVPALASLVPGDSVSIAASEENRPVDNLRSYPFENATAGPPVAWANVWPNASHTATHTRVMPASAGLNDLNLNIWLWITDLSGSTPNALRTWGITIIYTWQYSDGRRTRYQTGTVRSLRTEERVNDT